MSPRPRRLLALTLFVLLACPGAAVGGELDDHWNLGSLGGTADLVKKRVVIQSLIAKGPGDGKLKKGDVILTAGGTALGTDPFDVLGRMLDLGEKAGSIVLGIERGGTPQDIKLKLPKLGSYAGAFVSGNSKIKKHMKAACGYVVKRQLGGGVWHSYQDGQKHRGDAITVATVMSGLGLMAADPKKYKNAIKGARGFVLAEVRPSELGPDATSGLHRNWPVTFTTLFLAELYGQTGDKTVRKYLVAMLDRLVKNQEPTGGWSHFPGFSEGAGYKSLSSLTALALIAQGVASKTGVKVDAASVKKGLDYLEACISEGGAMAYSKVNGATGIQSAGRGCGALVAFHLHGRTGASVDKLRTYVLGHYKEVLESHPAPLTGVLFAAMLGGQWRSHVDKERAAFQARLAEHLVPFITLARHPKGFFMAQPSEETRSVGQSQGRPNADRSAHDPFWATSILLMLHGATKPRLVCLGAKARKR